MGPLQGDAYRRIGLHAELGQRSMTGLFSGEAAFSANSPATASLISMARVSSPASIAARSAWRGRGGDARSWQARFDRNLGP